MKKNITINLCGRLFQIDEDAYELLQQYIESLRQSFGREDDGDEIVNDIEARIAEPNCLMNCASRMLRPSPSIMLKTSSPVSESLSS